MNSTPDQDFERGYSAGELHNFLYGDASRVAELRVQARGRVAARHLWRELVESWAVPLVAWIAGLSRSWRSLLGDQGRT